jgi:hypothetical protein
MEAEPYYQHVERAAAHGHGDAPAGRPVAGAAAGRPSCVIAPAHSTPCPSRRLRLDPATRPHGRRAALPERTRQPLHAGQLLRRVHR